MTTILIFCLWMCFSYFNLYIICTNMFTYFNWKNWAFFIFNGSCFLFLTCFIAVFNPTSYLFIYLNGKLGVDKVVTEILNDICCRSVTKSCPTLCNPMGCNQPGSSARGISQARKLERVAISFSWQLPNPGIKPTSPALGSGFSTTEPPGKPFIWY